MIYVILQYDARRVTYRPLDISYFTRAISRDNALPPALAAYDYINIV